MQQSEAIPQAKPKGSMDSRILVKASILYSVVKYLILVMGFVKGFYVAKFLGPALLGTYGLIMLILDYMKYSNMGTLSAMNLEVSVNKGREEKKKYIQDTISNAFGSLVVLGGVYLLMGTLVHFYLWGWVPQDIRKYIYAVCVLGFMQQLHNYFIIHARLFDNFNLINGMEFFSNFIMLLGVILFIRSYQLDALIAVSLVSGFMTLAACFVILKWNRVTLNYSALKRLVIIGLPLIAYASSDHLFLSVDRVFISSYLSRRELGYYTFAYLLVNSTLVVIDSFAFLYYPRILNRLNQNNLIHLRQDEVYLVMKKYTSLIEVVFVALAMGGMVVVGPFVRRFLPEYSPSVLVYQILVLALIFVKMNYFTSTYLVSNKHQYSLVPMLLGGAATTALFNYIFIRLQFGINGVALATLCSFALYGAGLLALTLSKMKIFSFRNCLIFYKKYMAMLTCLLLLISCFPSYLFLGIIPFTFIYWRDIKRLRNSIFLSGATAT